MRSFPFVILLLLQIMAVACKQDASTTSDESAQASGQTESSASGYPSANTSSDQTAVSGGHDYTFLTNKILIFENSIGSEKGGANPYKDQWIDLMPDGTFKAGTLKTETHKGVWSYNHDTKTLFIKPHSPDHKMSEWTVMHNENMMVWVGTQTYGDNAYQIKMVWSDELP